MSYLDYIFVVMVFLIFGAVIVLVQRMKIKTDLEKEIEKLKEEKLKLENELAIRNRDQIIPVRLQAYERLVLLLERLNPHSMIFRVMKPGMNSLALQTMLLQNIRQEYEHNLAQQIYVSAEAWSMLKTAKEDLIKLINTAASKVQPQSEASALSKEIITLQADKTAQASNAAISMLKKEIHKLF
ncbi:MAG: hypothetical protein JXR34_08300 [Bacteroidales bacterium]|nr:hypothetical protein [Bacteroidales bacterium]